ncbi:MAG TPA: TAXI family TRAP transporter solute-binding subunit [Stellaceae bacterium]|nr:TAXI family TRAP transporter solute-binding subunit [Stellaceae bacterium]
MRMPRASVRRLFRCAGRIAAAAVVTGAALAAAQAETLAERTNRGLVEMIIDGDSASIDMARDLASVLDDGATRRVLPAVGYGAVQDLIDLKALRGVDIGIIQTDALDYAKKRKLLPGIENSMTYIAKLHNEELHVLARPEVKSLGDLAGKKVDFTGGAVVTGRNVFDLLHIKVEPVFEDRARALEKLKAGEIAAVTIVAAKPTALFERLRDADGLHFLPVPFASELAQAYVPARLTGEDYPRLVAADAPVDTIAVGAALMVAPLQPKSERYANVANFVEAFFTQFPHLQEAPRHPKWAEVNLAAELPGWKRFPAADAWLKHNVVAAAPAIDEKEMRDIFTKFLEERSRLAGGKAMSAQEKDQLFDQFRRWQTGALR